MTPDERLYRDLWLAELGTAVPELPRHEREAKRAADRRRQREMEDHQAELEAYRAPVLPLGEVS